MPESQRLWRHRVGQLTQCMTQTIATWTIMTALLIGGCDTLRVNPSTQDCKLTCEDCKGVEFECMHEGGGGEEKKAKGPPIGQ